MNNRLLRLGFVIWLLALPSLGCRQQMADQPSLYPDEPAPFLPRGTASIHPVEGTVARGHLQTDAALFYGRTSLDETIQPEIAGMEPDAASPTDKLLRAELTNYAGVVDEFPLPIDEQFIEHGFHRYMIYCVVCHDAVGTGHGKIVERGYTKPPSYHIARLRNAPVGHLFRVISEGYGSMPSYAAQIPVRDRWAIVAYLRALQLSQHYPKEELALVSTPSRAARRNIATNPSGEETPPSLETLLNRR